MSVIEKIRGRRESKELANFSAYRDLLKSLASNEDVDDVEVELTLQMVNKSLQDLERDVAKMAKRLAWSAQLQQEPALRQRERQAESEHQAALAELNEATQRLGSIVAAKQLALRSASNALGGVSEARSSLTQTCMDAALLHREAKLTQLILELRSPLRETEEGITKRKYELATLVQSKNVMAKHAHSKIPMYPQLTPPGGEDNSVGRERELRREIESFEQDLRHLQNQMAALQSEQSEIRQLKLQP